eukprot:TRINITY_DN3086_c0_g1_i1.p1 TRINITY_DN3086_c0_g1~~TRINITY_DN3086_c0_g1_i1.p1  ORF type:complete len:312 (-),score=59.07 TRINITY_DN3086_c0_g1_i1:39-974(-)
MGFCKCRRRTELWSTKSESPVCLDCICNEEHSLSTVKKYADWLENPTEETPVCPLSGQVLTSSTEVIRFLNLELYSLAAIDEYGRNLPPNTALAGYTIPGTNTPMVPPSDDHSKLAEQIRDKLKRFSWISSLIEAQSQSNSPILNEVGRVAIRKTNSISTSADRDHISLHIDGSPSIDPDDKYKKRNILGLGNGSRTSRRLCIIFGLVLIISTLFILSMSVDGDMRSQIEEELASHGFMAKPGSKKDTTETIKQKEKAKKVKAPPPKKEVQAPPEEAKAPPLEEAKAPKSRGPVLSPAFDRKAKTLSKKKD